MDDAVRQFEKVARNYVASESHARGRSLGRLLDLVQPRPGERVLDVAAGAGHTAIAFAGAGARAFALDPAQAMLAAARDLARARGLAAGAVRFVRAAAERLPFPDGAFAAVVCRTAAHHFADPAGAVREMARVAARPGGRVALTDLMGHDEPALDTLVDAVERLHDPTHVRSYRAAQWVAWFEAAGLRVTACERGFAELETGTSVRDWCVRSATPPAAEAEIRRLLLGAPAEHRRALRVAEAPEGDVRFHIYKCVVAGYPTAP